MRWIRASMIATVSWACLAAAPGQSDENPDKAHRDAQVSEPAPTVEEESVLDEPPPPGPPFRGPWQGGMKGKPEPGGRGGPFGRSGPGRDSPDRHGPFDDDAMTPEQVDKLMKFLEDHLPQLHERLARLRKADPGTFGDMIQRRFIAEIWKLMQRDPEAAKAFVEMHKVEMKLGELRAEFHGATDDEQREQIKARMREQVARRCDLRTEHLRIEIQRLQELLERVTEELTRREQSRDEMIEKELEEVLRKKPRVPDWRHGPRVRKRGPSSSVWPEGMLLPGSSPPRCPATPAAEKLG